MKQQMKPSLWFGLVLAATMAIALVLGGNRLQPAAAARPSDSVTATALADTTVSSSSPSQNSGAVDRIFVGSLYQGDIYSTWRMLVRFDLPALPAGAQITAAHVRLYQMSSAGSSPVTLEACRVTSDWAESTVTWNTQPSVGGTCATTSVGTDNSVWREWDATGIVAAWYGGSPNLGFRIRRPNDEQTQNNRRDFASREWANPPLRPQLVIEYQVVPLSGWIRTAQGCEELGQAPIYHPGDTLTARLRVDGRPSVYVRVLYLGGPTGAQEIDNGTINGGQEYDMNPQSIGAGAGGRRTLTLEAQISGGYQELGRCSFTILPISPTPTRTQSPTRSATPTRTSSPTPTLTPAPGTLAPPSGLTCQTITNPAGRFNRLDWEYGGLAGLGTATPTARATVTRVPGGSPTVTPTRTPIPTATMPPNFSDFHIERSDTLEPGQWTEITTVGANARTYSDGPLALQPGDVRSYRVRAHAHGPGQEQWSAYSNVASCEVPRLPTDTPVPTPTEPPPTDTPVPTSTATPSATSTATATPTIIPTPTPSTMFLAPCRPDPAGWCCTIDFDWLPNGRETMPGDVIRDQYQDATGVGFPEGGRIIEPKRGANSPPHALYNSTSDQTAEFNAHALKIAFSTKVRKVRLHVGLDQALSGIRPQLTVYGDGDTRTAVTLGDPFPIGPMPITQLIESPEVDFDIQRAELLYVLDAPADAIPVPANAVEVVDDMKILSRDTGGCVPGGDTQAPVVTITTPAGGTIFSGSTLPLLAGTISEDSGKVRAVRLTVDGPGGTYTVGLGPYLYPIPCLPVVWPGTCGYDYRFEVANLGLFEGENTITVEAEDAACPPNRAAAAVTVEFRKPPADLNIYAMGIEITQAIQDTVQTREVTHEFSSSTPFLPIPFTGVPLVAHKRTVVRAYAEVVELPGLGPIYGVPALLKVRRGGKTTELTALGIPVDPADQVNNTDGTRNVARTLEKKRADIGKSWNFVLPDALTAEGEIDELEIRINPGVLGGVVERLGFNDRANWLTVARVPFNNMPTLRIQSYYVKPDGDVAGADAKLFCSDVLNMWPVSTSCGSAGTGIRLLPLITDRRPKSESDDSCGMKNVMCGLIKTEKGSMQWEKSGFALPGAYVAIAGGGCGDAPDERKMYPAACAATVYQEPWGPHMDYGAAAQEVGHGSFSGYSVGHSLDDPSYPKYEDSFGNLYFHSSIGTFGLNTTDPDRLSVQHPQYVIDFMGFTYFQIYLAYSDPPPWWVEGSWPVGTDLLIFADQSFRVGADPSSMEDLIAKGKGGKLTARGITFQVTSHTPKTTARPHYVELALEGSATDGDIYVQRDSGPPVSFTVTGKTSPDIAKGIRAYLNGITDTTQIFGRTSWVSPFTYRRWYDNQRKPPSVLSEVDGALSTQATTGQQQPERATYLFTSGTIKGGNQASLDPFYQEELPSGRDDLEGTGPFSLELHDAAGQALFVRRFEPNRAHPEAPGVRQFIEMLPFATGTRRIVLKDGERVLASRTVSETAPRVRLTQPSGGESWQGVGRRPIEWTASDSDGDRLYAQVRYSTDAGRSWHIIAGDVTESRVEVSPAELPGGEQCRIRVLVTDGVNTVQTESAPFSVAKRDPHVWIDGARDGATVAPGEVLSLIANYVDPDGDVIPEAAFTWESDRSGTIGSGSRLDVPAAALPPGGQVLRVAVPGENGRRVVGQVRILRVPTWAELRRLQLPWHIYLPRLVNERPAAGLARQRATIWHVHAE